MSLFDDLPRRRRPSPAGGGAASETSRPGSPPPSGPETVGQLTARIDAALKRFGRVAVEGEISRPKTVNSGHVFFTLKDSRAAIDAKIWRGQLAKALPPGMKLEDGASVVCHGTLDVYAPYGKHSLIVDRVEVRGMGVLLADLERLKVRLRDEGLFERRRPLPRFPRMVGVVTSRDADAWRDFLRTRSLRWPGYPVRIAHSRVQGKTAAREIAGAIAALDRSGVDVIVVCRGGGAIEDLWCFNEEVVARAVWASSVPVVTGVGHESDTTLVDFVADHRGHTPTDAAQTVLPDQRVLLDAVERQSAYLTDVMERQLASREERLQRAGRARVFASPDVLVLDRERRVLELGRRARAALDARLAAAGTAAERVAARLERQSPVARLERLDERLSALGTSLHASTERRLRSAEDSLERAGASATAAMARALDSAAQRLEPAARTLAAVSPLAVLERGYSITQTIDGDVVQDPHQLREGASLRTILRHGEIDSVVEATRRAPERENLGEDGGGAPPKP